MEIQSLLPFEFKETLNKWKFLEKDPIREKQFIMLLRKYKQFTIILQKDLEQFSGFIIKINAENFLKEVKVKNRKIKYFD